MLFTNFLFDGSVGLRHEGKHFDLHSFFSIRHVCVDPRKGAVTIHLAAIEEFRDLVHGVRALVLTFDQVDYLEFSPGFCKTTSDTVEEIGFKAVGDMDDNWLKTAEQSKSTDHIFIRLSSLEFVRLSFAKATVTCDGKSAL